MMAVTNYYVPPALKFKIFAFCEESMILKLLCIKEKDYLPKEH
jgi:hypothetical protein